MINIFHNLVENTSIKQFFKVQTLESSPRMTGIINSFQKKMAIFVLWSNVYFFFVELTNKKKHRDSARKWRRSVYNC